MKWFRLDARCQVNIIYRRAFHSVLRISKNLTTHFIEETFMLRNTFFALLTVLAAAASSQAAIMLEQSTGTALDDGLVSYILTATTTDPVDINGVNNPSIVAGDDGMGLHQVWMPLLGATPTQGEHNPLAFNPGWAAYDSYWFFDTTNSLSIGGAFTETNDETDGAEGLPDGPAGPARSGFGTLGFGGASASKSFTVASGNAGQSVDFAQLVMKEGEFVNVSLRVLTADSQFNQTLENICIGACGVVEPPTVDDDFIGDFLRGGVAGLVSGTLPSTGDGLTWTLDSFTGPGGAVAGGTVDPTSGEFSWQSLSGSALGAYSAVLSAANADGSDSGTLSFNIVVPEPASISLLGLALVGGLGFIRRR